MASIYQVMHHKGNLADSYKGRQRMGLTSNLGLNLVNRSLLWLSAQQSLVVFDLGSIPDIVRFPCKVLKFTKVIIGSQG